MSLKVKQTNPIEVFAGEFWNASMIKDMLVDNGIPAFIFNEYEGTMAPFRVQAGGSNPIKVVVNSDDYDTAVQYIQEFNANSQEERSES
jgi:hypothetical protein